MNEIRQQVKQYRPIPSVILPSLQHPLGDKYAIRAG